MDPFQIENLMDNEIEVHHQDGEIPTKMYQCVKVTLIASLNGYAPTLAVEFGRKVISAEQRPSFAEMEGHFKQQRK